MVVKYVTTDLGRWGVGVGAPLDAEDVDTNFWETIERVTTLEALPDAAAMIQDILVEGDQMTIVMDDYTTFGPFTLPVYQPSPFVWTPSVNVVPGQMFSKNSTIYIVAYPHLTVSPFDPAENDGLGNNYYEVFVAIDGTIPAGGDTYDILMKDSATDQDVSWVPAACPTGGLTGYILKKNTNTNYDYDWSPDTVQFSTLNSYSGTAINIVSGSQGMYLRLTNAVGVAINIQNGACSVNDEVTFRQAGTGYVIIETAPGVTLNIPLGFTNRLYGQGATATIKKVATNEWDLMGLLQPA